jgi:hypothetical protein
VLREIVDDILAHSLPTGNLIDRFAKIGFFEIINVERVTSFEHRLKRFFNASRCRHGLGKTRHRFGEFSRRRDTNFIGIKISLLKFCKSLVSRFVSRIFKATSVQQVVKNFSVGWRSDRFIVFFESFIELLKTVARWLLAMDQGCLVNTL